MLRRVTAIQNWREISHRWIFCFMSCKTWSSTRFSIVCSQFSILYSLRNQESRIESRNWDSQWIVNWLLNGIVSVTALLKDWLTNWLTDWLFDWLDEYWMLTILLADWLTGLFKGGFIIYVEGAMVPMAIYYFLGQGGKIFSWNFVHSFS